MDAEDRSRLQQRRHALQEEIRLRARRERIRERTELLDAHGVAYELSFDDGAQVAWVWRHFAMGGGLLSPRVDWERVRVRDRGPASGEGDGEAAAWLARLSAAHGLWDGDAVVVLTGNGADPAVHLAFGGLVTHPQVVSCGSDVWVVCEAGGWLIEFLRFQDGWWWGRAPAAHQPA